MRPSALETGPLQVLSHFGSEYEHGPAGEIESWVRNPDGRLRGKISMRTSRAMREIGYQGYVGYELCHPLPVVDGSSPPSTCVAASRERTPGAA